VGLTMDTDIVVYRGHGERAVPCALCAVLHSQRVGNSDMKWKRSRPEYVESETLATRLPAVRLDPAYRTVMVVFGSKWKGQVLDDFSRQLRPSIIVCRHLSEAEELVLFRAVERIYWTFKGDRTQETAAYISAHPYQVPHSQAILRLLSRAIWGKRQAKPTPLITSELRRLKVAKRATRLPPPFWTRYNHGLSLLALFPPDEQRALFELHSARELQPTDLAEPAQSALVRALFLGVVSLVEVHRIRRKGERAGVRVAFHLRRSVADFDFDFIFSRMPSKFATGMVVDLLGLARDAPATFQGAVSSLRMSNLEALVEPAQWINRALLAHLNGKGGLDEIVEALRNHATVLPLPSVWRGSATPLLAAWSYGVALVITLHGDRNASKRHRMSRVDVPTATEAKQLIRALLAGDKDLAIAKLRQTSAWLTALDQRDWPVLSRLSTSRTRWLAAVGAARTGSDWEAADRLERDLPIAVDMFIPSSWLQWQYNVLATHPSFAPATLVAYRRLAQGETAGGDLHGFPSKRSVAISDLLPGHRGRAQFAMIGRVAEKLVSYEGKSITENHFGDKSKELFDRVGEFKRACADAGVMGDAVIVLDGDFGVEQLNALGSATGYDRIYSLDEFVPPKDGA
jgi:hypothetical protein